MKGIGINAGTAVGCRGFRFAPNVLRKRTQRRAIAAPYTDRVTKDRVAISLSTGWRVPGSGQSSRIRP